MTLAHNRPIFECGLSFLGALIETNLSNTFNEPTNTDLANAFVLGLTASGTQTMFDKLCHAPIKDDLNDPKQDKSFVGLTPGEAFKKAVTAAILKLPPMQCMQPGVFSIKAGNYAESRDYLGITCAVQ